MNGVNGLLERPVIAFATRKSEEEAGKFRPVDLTTMVEINSNLLDLVMDKCRICLEHHGTINIFNTPRLAEDIRLCTHINVKSDDVFPKNICISCKRGVSAAKALRKVALGTLAKLRFITGETTKIEPILPGVTFLEPKKNNEEPTTEVNRKENKSKNHHKKRKKKSSLSILRKSKPNSSDDIKKNIMNPSAGMKIPKIILIANNYPDSTYEIKNKDLLSSQSNKDDVHQKKIEVAVVSPTELTQSPNKKEADSPVDSSASKEKTDFRCKKCDRKCPSRVSLFLHLRSHEPSKILHCPICEKPFLSKSDLTKHTRTHTGEKPFVCRRCHKGFSQNSTLKAHRKLNKCGKVTPEEDIIEENLNRTPDKDTLNSHPKNTPDKDTLKSHRKNTPDKDTSKKSPVKDI